MSTTSSPSKKNDPEKSAQPAGGSETPKKRKSAGFIESADFKPNWLETGPLSPEMLPESLSRKKGDLTQDEIEILQDSLQRFYMEAGEPVPDALISKPAREAHIEEEQPSPEPAEAMLTDTLNKPASELPEAAIEVVAETPTPENAEMSSPAPEPADWIKAIAGVDAAAEVTGSTAALPATEAAPAAESAVDDFICDDIDEDANGEAKETFEAEPVTEIAPPAVAPESVAPTKPVKVKRPKVKRRRDRLTPALLITSLLLLAAAALIYFVNPFARLALGSASLARPVSSPGNPSPATGSGEWCLSGDFPGNAGPLRLADSGEDGDFLTEDGVFSLEHAIAAPGTYKWQVADCANSELVYPQEPAWVTTTTPDQTVTFNFDSNERSDPLFFPISFVVSADDGAGDFRVLGNFQEWDPDDQSSQLQPINMGLYQQIRRIANPGEYQAYIISGSKSQAIDAYGRATAPIPFAFQTDRNDEYVVFLVDTDRGRASVLYDMSPVFTSLAYGNGHWRLSLILGSLAILTLLAILLRLAILNNRRLQLESGCPNCGRHELIRISRRSSDRLLHVFGIPAYRYRCRNCTWEGSRLSDTGVSISPGVELAHTDI